MLYGNSKSIYPHHKRKIMLKMALLKYFVFEIGIELSNDVVKEIAKKYENVQKGIGDMMSGALIETEARTILNQGIKQGIKQGIEQGIKQGKNETEKNTALKMLERGKLSIEEIAEYSGLSVAEVERLAELQTL